MSANNTHDFDVLVQISESELNDQLKAIFLSCDGGIPRGFDNFLGYLNFDMPTMEIVDSAGRVSITLPVSNSQVKLNGEEKDLDGSIVITNNIVVFDRSRSASIGLDFQSGDVGVKINIDQLNDEQKDMFKNIVLDKLSSINEDINEDGRIYLTEITLRQHATETFTPSKVEVTTVNSPEGNCLTIALQMAYDRVGDINQVNSYLIPNGHSAAIIISTDWLLGHVLRPQLAQELSVPPEHFDKPLKLNQSILLRGDDYDATLTSMEVNTVAEYLRVSGHLTVHNPGPDVEVDFFIDINIEIGANGELQPVAGDPQLSMFVLAEPVVEDTVKNEINSALNGFTSNSYSLGALAEGFEIASVHIEDNLVLSADVISDDMPEDIPLISIQSSWTEPDREDPDWRPRFGIPGRFSQEVIWHGEFEALACRAAFPIEYEWFFNEEALEAGEDHQINTGDGSLTYNLDQQVLKLKATSVGQPINGKLCVRAVDGRNRELNDCINIHKAGSASRNDGGLNQKQPDNLREWVNPTPVDPMWQGKIDPDIVAKIDPDVVSKLMDNEGVTTLKELRTHLDLTQKQMAKRVGLSQADYAQFERGKKLR